MTEHVFATEVGVNLTAVYSDHDHQLVACADDSAGAAAVAAAWRR